MIICESNGDLVLEFIYNLLAITMNKFFELMASDLTSPPCLTSKTPPNTEEIKSPSSYLDGSNSKKFFLRKNLQLDSTDVEKFDNLASCGSEKYGKNSGAHFSPDFKRRLFTEEVDASLVNSNRKESNANLSFNQSLEEFKMCMMYEKTAVHSSPKLINSHFEDSGFLNCSMETSSQMGTISGTGLIPEKNYCSNAEDKFSIPFDSYLNDAKDRSKIDKNSNPKRNFTQSLTEYSEHESSNC